MIPHAAQAMKLLTPDTGWVAGGRDYKLFTPHEGCRTF